MVGAAHVRARLEAALDRRFDTGGTVDELAPMTAGASSDTWRFSAAIAGARRVLVLRRAASQDASLRIPKPIEAQVQRAAHNAGVPVAPVAFVLDAADELGDGYVMSWVDGETLARRYLRDDAYAAARAAMTRQCGAILARVHSIELADVPALPALPAAAQLERLEALYRSFDTCQPVFEVALRWLADRAPPAPTALALVHGDFRCGNFAVGPEGIRAVFDWELAHAGDPLEDLGWLCVPSWRFGCDAPVGGFGARADLYEAYGRATGLAVEPRAVHFWEVLGTLKWGIVCMLQAFEHLRGDVRSVERAAIGRRVSETEHDLLTQLESPR